MKKQVPEWFKKSAVYQINPRTFSSEGTIRAITNQLPFLKDLGFKIVYLCPIFEADDSSDPKSWSVRQKASQTNNPKNPYRMNDYYNIDSEYGTMDDLRELVRESHKLGMRVMLDLVYLHIGPNSDVIKNYPSFVMKNEDGTIKYTYWNFPHLNFEDPGLREYLWSNMTYYVGAIGVDGFRCDVGDEVPLDFWVEGIRRIRTIKPDTAMINEGQRAGHLAAFDANYSFYWHQGMFDLFAGTTTAKNVIDRIHQYEDKYPEGSLVLRNMDNHDTVTDWPYRIEEHYGNDSMELALAACYTIDGVPMVYCGNELADTAKLSMFANRFYPGRFEFTDRNAAGAHVERRKEVIKTLNSLKAHIAAFSDGKTEWILTDNDSVLSFRRTGDEEQILFAGNFSTEPVEIRKENGEILLYNHAVVKKDTVRLLSYGYVIIRKS